MTRTGNRKAAWTLVVLTPVIAEVALGSTPVRLLFLLPLWTPIYGAGVLLIREAVRRAGGGWGSLVLLGAAYEIVEDGIGLQALTSPRLYGAADWAPRLFGFNTAYWEVNLGYHVVFSVLIPVAVTNLLFPSHRDRPYLKRTGLIVTACCALLGVGLLRVTVPLSQDPGYDAPLPALIGYVVAVAALAVAALAVLPRLRARRAAGGVAGAVAGAVPGFWPLSVVGGVGTVAFLGLLFPFGGARQPAFTHGAWSLVPMAIAAVLAVSLLVVLRRWTARAAWTDRSMLALAGGALVGHTAFGLMLSQSDIIDRAGLALIAAATIAGIAWLHRRIDRRTLTPATTDGAPPRTGGTPSEMPR